MNNVKLLFQKRLKVIFLIICIIICVTSNNQLLAQKITGTVIDGKTKAPLAFVNIVAVDQNLGTTTDIDGRFSFKSTIPINKLKLSYVGYKLIEIDISGKQAVLIELEPTRLEIEEFTVLPGINPAERIINRVIKNRKKHNPEKSLDFKYDSYSKLYFTVEPDSSYVNNPEKLAKLDTSDQKFVSWLKSHHLFMMESVTERKYKQPDKNYERVLASRVSGLKNPSFSLLATQLQSFSFYDPTLLVFDKTYLNPITKNSINKYLFLIEDTTYNGADTVFILSFRPRKGKNFDALKGLLYINTGGYALQNVIAEPAKPDETASIKIQQQYKKIDGSWFPIQLNTNLIFNPEETEGEFKMVGVSRSYLKNIEINPEISNKEFSYIDTEIDIDANKQNEDFWNRYREDTLSQIEQNTYHVVDSIGEKMNFDKKILIFEALLTGKLRLGSIDLDLNRFFGFNNYEGFRLGAGFHTNRRFSNWFSIGGYGAYSFKDKEEKYGGDVNFFIDRRNDIELNFSYVKDVAEPGVIDFYDYKIPLFSNASTRILYLDRMNDIKKVEARLKFRTLRYLKTYLFANQEKVEVTNDYYFNQTIDQFTTLRDRNYTFSEVGVEFRYAYKEKVIKTQTEKYAKPIKYPIIYAKIERGTELLDGEYEYTRLTIRAEKKFFIKKLGHPSFFIEAGYVDGDAPQHKLNTAIGTFRPDARLTFGAENVFETMLPYEFFSSEYVHLHLRHSFGRLLLKIKKFEPEFVVTSSVGFGALNNPELHQGVEFKTLEKGFYESGLLINNIFRFNSSTFGVGGFYRYGPNQLEKTSDNFAFKASLGYYF